MGSGEPWQANWCDQSTGHVCALPWQTLVNLLWLGVVNDLAQPRKSRAHLVFGAASGVHMAIGVLWRNLLTAALCILMPSLVFAVEAAPDESLRATSFAMTGDARTQRITIAFDRDPGLNWFLLKGPHRLVLDFAPTRFVFEPGTLKPNRMIESVRFGDVGEGRSRLILVASGPFTVDKVEIVDSDQKGARKLSIEIAGATAGEFDAALADQKVTTSSTNPIVATDVAAPDARRFTIVLDPGHGGIDGGARGSSGTSEKQVTLTFAEELKAKLEKTGRYEVVMTRTDDRFIRLDDRVKFARERQADLFISIHADTIRYKGIRGATVYTVSDEASDAEAAELADRENLADQVAGIEIEEENRDVADILVELVRRETHGFSITFARNLVGKLSSVTGMIKNPHRHAGFRVLRAPDIPSVLLELGYLSNEKDEAQLLDADWRAKTADSVAAAIEAFAGTRVSANK